MEDTLEELVARVAETKQKYGDNHWWESEDPAVLFWGQINEPILIISFGEFQEATEKALKRPVFTHEFVDPESLKAEFQKKIPKATFEDIMNKFPAGKRIIVIVT